MSGTVNEPFVINGFVETDNKALFDRYPGNGAVYEVVRVIEGVPLFFDEHLERLAASLSCGKKDILSDVSKDIKKLIQQYTNMKLSQISISSEANLLCNFNIRIIYQEGDRLLHISQSRYPEPEEYKTGWKTIFLEMERVEPNSKIFRASWKNEAERLLSAAGVYEGILVDKKGYMTEGSRSNVFFLYDNKIYTAPDESVLKGISRNYAIMACNNAGIFVNYEALEKNHLERLEAAFFTGTSINIMPISAIGACNIPSANNRVIQALMSEYSRLVRSNIELHAYDWR